MSRRALTLLVAAVLTVVAVAVGLAVPVPYVELRPGPTFDTLADAGDGKPLIVIGKHATHATKGELRLTTVSVAGGPGRGLSLSEAVAGWLADRDAVLPEELLYPPDEAPSQVEAENALEMQESQNHAKVAALRELGITVPTEVVVAQVQPGSPAAGAGLREGDVLVRADGTLLASSEDLRTAITRHTVGQSVRLVVRRAGVTMDVEVRTRASSDGGPQRPVIGVAPGIEPDLPFPIDIRLQDVGGPSAGLMFALGIVDKLTDGALAGGRVVAGTGTIDDDGTVGPIGGIRQKLYGARAAGATVFLVPGDNCAEAISGPLPAGLQLIRVASLHQARRDLQLLARGSTTLPSCRS